jgi:hypothetical protein
MMNLYIQIREGQPYQHPILEDNLLQAFPGIDLNNLPPNLARFVRIAQPGPDLLPVGNFEVANCNYELMSDGATYHDVWSVRDMTDAEKTQATRTRVTQNTNQLAAMKEWADAKIAETTGDVQTAWQSYLSLLNSLTITDPFAVEWPAVPQVDEEGNLVTP